MLQKEGSSGIGNFETNKITCTTCVSVWLCACLHECWSPIGVLFPFCCCLASFWYGQLALFVCLLGGGGGGGGCTLCGCDESKYQKPISSSERNQQKSSIPVCEGQSHKRVSHRPQLLKRKESGSREITENTTDTIWLGVKHQLTYWQKSSIPICIT